MTLTDEDRALIEGVAGPMLLKAEMAIMEWATLSRVISAARTQSQGEGWVLVPRVPTVEMLVAATEEWLCVRSQEDRAEFIWDAMLAAAPPASQTKG